MRILHVHSGNLYGGVESTLVDQARHTQLCAEMQLSFALCFEGRFSTELIDSGASVSWLDRARTRNPVSIRRARRALHEILVQEPFDAIVTHSCWSQAMFGPVVRAAGLPLIFYLHGPANGRHWLELWARRTQPRMVVCNSRFTAATVTNLYPETPAEVVYCPVAPAQFGPSETNTDRIRAELGTPKDATVIIQVSRMEAGKGHAVHLEALSLIKNLPGWICWQVGSPQQTSERKYLERLTKLADRAGISDRVVFVDRPANIRELLAAADIFCQPNTRPESFGIAFVEALYAQLPVVTTNIGGAREIIDDSCGLLIQPDDPQAVAAALRVLIEDGPFRQKLGTAGPKRARDLTDVHAQMARLRHCFLSAQNGNGKASRTGGRSA